MLCWGCAQEKQIRAKQGMKQLSKRMTEQRLQALERLRKNMTGSGQPVRILPRDMEQGLKEFASGVEQLVDRLVRPPSLACLAYLNVLSAILMDTLILSARWKAEGMSAEPSVQEELHHVCSVGISAPGPGITALLLHDFSLASAAIVVSGACFEIHISIFFLLKLSWYIGALKGSCGIWQNSVLFLLARLILGLSVSNSTCMLVCQVSGELGLEMAQHADKFMIGVISNVESSYSKFEQAIKRTLRMPITRKRQPARRAKQVCSNPTYYLRAYL
jgi:hypothetical protein